MIKPVDKGIAIVIWDKGDYLKDSKNYLNDNIVRGGLTGDPLQTLKKETDKKLNDYLFVKNSQFPRFYLLLKIHK